MRPLLLILFLLLTNCFKVGAQAPPDSLAQAAPPPDTLWLTNGEVILVKNVTPNRRTVHYQWATGDSSQREARFSKVLGIRKSGGSCEVTKGKYRVFCAPQSERVTAGGRLAQANTPTATLAFSLMYGTSLASGLILTNIAQGQQFGPGSSVSLASLFFIASPTIPVLLFGGKGPARITPVMLRKYPMLNEPYYRAGFESVERPNKRMLIAGGISGFALGSFFGLGLSSLLL